MLIRNFFNAFRKKLFSPILNSYEEMSIIINQSYKELSSNSYNIINKQEELSANSFTIIKKLEELYKKLTSNENPKIIHPNHMSEIGRKRLTFDLTNIENSQLELLSFEINEKNIGGNVAELGVWTGNFAQLLNIAFPMRKLYLFDTFEGFDNRDIQTETANNFSEANISKDFYVVSSTDIVLKKIQNPELCIIKKGWFPETARDIEDIFCFVHLDADLFEPIYAGLNYFYPRLAVGGYILIHDYNNIYYQGVKAAVRKFCTENNISYTPLCDYAGSVVITK
jgi:O-methyltransferase